MVKLFAIAIICFSVLLGQDTKKIENPCQSELIKKAKREGVRSIKIAELPTYVIELWKCRKENDGKKTLKRINEKTYIEDYESAESFVGFTATCAYCSAASVLIFYIFKLSGN